MANEKPDKRKVSKKEIFISIGIVLAGIFFVYSFFLYQQKKQTEKIIQERNESVEVNAVPASLTQTNAVIEYEGKTYRRNTYMKAILLMGVDTQYKLSQDHQYGAGRQSDGVFLVAQDTARNTVKVLMIPRDTMTEIALTDLTGNIIGTNKQHLTLAFSYGDGQNQSCEFMRDAVSTLLNGLKIDSYFAISLKAISILNDDVGGVTVTVPYAGMEKSDPELIEGNTVTLSGEQAEKFVRYRDTNEDFSAIKRMGAQEIYILGFQEAIKKAERTNSDVVNQMFADIADYMLTDMNKAQYLKLGLDMATQGQLTKEDIMYVTGENKTTELYDEFYPDKDALTKQVLELFYREE